MFSGGGEQARRINPHLLIIGRAYSEEEVLTSRSMAPPP
jgi:hypothetical protein